MIERITKNEERLDSALVSIKKLDEALEEYKLNHKNINMLKKYYGSRNWFKDKEAYENGSISKIKAGVLSEDAVWNMLEDEKEIIEDMKRIIASYEKNK